MSTDRVIVHGYQPVGDQRAADGAIVIEGHFPDEPAPTGGEPFKEWERRAAAKFELDAQAVYGVLAHNLPGGTMHQLLILMLKRQVNLLVVK